MTTSPTGSLNDYLRQVLRSGSQDKRSDAELLTTFSQVKEERAFTSLVARYGLMVWSCRRNLPQQQDAEDAFQATFLVLAQKAGQISFRVGVSHWLYCVARRVSWKLSRSVLRRQIRERQVLEMPPITYTAARANASQQELLTMLDEQIERLPRRYREALLLCRLGSKTYAEAAEKLGCSTAAVSHLLTKAEQLLRKQLSRRGMALSSGAVAAALSQATDVCAMPAGLPGETVRAALAFANNSLAPSRALWIAQGVLQSMGTGKTTLMWGVLVAALLSLGGTGLSLVVHSLAVCPQAQAQSVETAPANPGVPNAPCEQGRDLWGDPLPEGAVARIGTLRFRLDERGMKGYQSDSAFLPDGNTLVSAHGTNLVYFWDLTTGKERRRLQIQDLDAVNHVRISSDGTLLAINGWKKVPEPFRESEVQVWDLTSDPPRFCWKRKAQGNFSDIAFSPDGNTLACSDSGRVSKDPQSRKIYLLDAKTGKQCQHPELTSAPHWCGRLAFSPNGMFLAQWYWGGGSERTVFLWEVATGKRWHTGNRSYISFIGFSPDSQTMATRDREGFILWDVVTGEERRRIPRADARFTSAVFLPDGTFLEVDGETLRFSNLDNGKECRPRLVVPGLAPAYVTASSTSKDTMADREELPHP